MMFPDFDTEMKRWCARIVLEQRPACGHCGIEFHPGQTIWVGPLTPMLDGARYVLACCEIHAAKLLDKNKIDH